jgi:hypothetical protein
VHFPCQCYKCTLTNYGDIGTSSEGRCIGGGQDNGDDQNKLDIPGGDRAVMLSLVPSLHSRPALECNEGAAKHLWAQGERPFAAAQGDRGGALSSSVLFIKSPSSAPTGGWSIPLLYIIGPTEGLGILLMRNILRSRHERNNT